MSKESEFFFEKCIQPKKKRNFFFGTQRLFGNFFPVKPFVEFLFSKIYKNMILLFSPPWDSIISQPIFR